MPLLPPVHSHPHSPSPTPYTNPNPTTAPASIRRNLFSAHLSRRPASSSQPQSESTIESAPVSFIPPLSPRRSPTRSPDLPHSASAMAIIATHANGRPLLPTLPRLPAHLRLSTTSDDEPYSQPRDDDPDGNNSPTRYNHPPSHAHVHNLEIDEEEHEDRARIEKGLVEMMWRQRQRANLAGTHGVGAGGGMADTRRGPGGEKSREEEELMGLIMDNLREKVMLLEGEGWMFGGRGEEG